MSEPLRAAAPPPIDGGATADQGALALAVALTEQQTVYERLLVVSQREERAIVAGDVSTLTQLVEEKEQLLELLAAHETDRMTAVTSIALATGVRSDSATLSELAGHVGADAGTAMLSAGLELRAQALAVKEANERNARLLRGSRELVDRWIQYLRTVVSSSLAYTADGAAQESDGFSVVDRSA